MAVTHGEGAMRVVAMFALGVLGVTGIGLADDKKPAEGKWPAYVDGKFVHKTITFKPDKVELRDSGGRRGGTIVIFRIKDEKIPADYVTGFVLANILDAEKLVEKY